MTEVGKIYYWECLSEDFEGGNQMVILYLPTWEAIEPKCCRRNSRILPEPPKNYVVRNHVPPEPASGRTFFLLGTHSLPHLVEHSTRPDHDDRPGVTAYAEDPGA